MSAVLAFVACQNVGLETDSSEVVEGNSGQEFKEVIITASIADGQQVSKTTYNEDEAKNYWTPGDKIKVFSAGYTSEFTSINTAPAPVVNFKGVVTFISGSSNDDDDSKYYVWGLYPYSDEAVYEEPDGISRTARITTTYPDAQVGVAGTFGDGLSVMIGRSESLSIPFKGAYSGAFFQVSRDDIVSMTLRGLNGETLAGTATIGLNSALTPVVHSVADPKVSVTVTAPNGTFEPGMNYYLVTLPDVALPDGYSVTLERSDGSYGTYEVRANRPLNRIKFRNLSEPVDVRIENENNIANGTSTGWMRPDGNIVFADPKVKSICVENWDTDGDGELSYTEAAAVTDLGTVFKENTEIVSFDEFQYFTGGVNNATFYGCSSLKSIVIPSNVSFTYVNTESEIQGPFENCTSLSSVKLPEEHIGMGNQFFKGCTGLTSIVLPEWVIRIADQTFSGCTSLTSVVLPGGLKCIASQAFRGCTSLTSIELPEGLTEIGGSAFYDCKSLTSIELPEGVTFTNSAVFSNCSSLTSIVLPSGFKEVPQHTFSYCTSLTSIMLPDGLTSIGSSAFLNCGSLTSIVLPDGLTSIGSSAFLNCSRLTSIVLPDGLTSIGDNAFFGCFGLTSIELPEGLTSIGNNAFSRCTGLTSIELPEGLTSIGKGAFYGCTSLTSIELPNSLYTLPNGDPSISLYPDTADERGIFEGCTTLTAIKLPNRLKSIPIRAFEGCTALTTIVIPNSLTSISVRAFKGCVNLMSINLPDGFTSIGSSAFLRCSGLTSITIPDSVTNIDDNAFNGCSSLTSINLPDGITSIAGYAFTGCSALTNISIPVGVTSIKNGAFKGCSNLTSINLPDGITSIGGYAFASCSALTSITIPDSVTSMTGGGIFEECSALTSVTIYATTPPALSYSPFITTYQGPIYVPAGSVEAYKVADYWSEYADQFQAIQSETPQDIHGGGEDQ